MAFQRRNVLFGILSLPASTLLSGRPLPGLTATVYNGYEFHTAIQAAGPGSSIMLAPGNYGDIGSFIFTSSNVSVGVRSLHQAVFRSPLIVNGDFVDLQGLAFEQGLQLVGTGLVIGTSKFTGNGIDAKGVNTEVHHCDISRYGGNAIDISANATNAYVHHNHIHDSISGSRSAIGVGQATVDTNKRVNARLVNNLMQNCVPGSTETICIKSSANTITGNRLINCNNISNRHGEGNAIVRNRLERSMGIVIQDARTVVTDNVLVSTRQGPGIQVMTGTSAWNAHNQGDHPQAAFTVLRGNSGGLVIGRTRSRYNYPAINTRVESHNGSISLGMHTGTSLPGGKGATTEGDGGGKKKKKKGSSAEAI
jgi:hypothetical protein